MAVGVSQRLSRTRSRLRRPSLAFALSRAGRRRLPLLAEVLGKADGASRGMGGSMHLYGREVGFYGSVPLVGATIPLAVGAGLAAKLDGGERCGCRLLRRRRDRGRRLSRVDEPRGGAYSCRCCSCARTTCFPATSISRCGSRATGLRVTRRHTGGSCHRRWERLWRWSRALRLLSSTTCARRQGPGLARSRDLPASRARRSQGRHRRRRAT